MQVQNILELQSKKYKRKKNRAYLIQAIYTEVQTQEEAVPKEKKANGTLVVFPRQREQTSSAS